MSKLLLPTLTLTILFLSILYQYALKDILFVTFGLGRTLQPIEAFPYQCRRLTDDRLHSCEDLWLDQEGRTLYAACSDVLRRREWSPGGNRYNATTALTSSDHISMLQIDALTPNGLYNLKTLTISPSTSPAPSTLSLHGISINPLNSTHLRLHLINHRPPLRPSGQPLDASTHGANSTIEIFDLARGETAMQFVKTVVSEAVATPNNLAADAEGGFLVSNDHNSKVGAFRDLEMLIGGGSLAYCNAASNCTIVTTSGLNFPNGIIRGLDGLFYVASSSSGRISVHALQPNKTLLKIEEIAIGMPLDNLSIDENGDIFAAAFPSPIKLIRSLDHPFTTDVPSTVFRVRKLVRGGYEVKKVLEDKEGKVLPGTTTAVYDVKTDRYFLGGIASPYITLCEPRSL